MTTLHGSARNYVLHFDYQCLGNSTAGYMNALAFEGDFSDYCCQSPTPSATAELTASTLARWTRTFIAPKLWVSDQGSHFINHILE